MDMKSISVHVTCLLVAIFAGFIFLLPLTSLTGPKRRSEDVAVSTTRSHSFAQQLPAGSEPPVYDNSWDTESAGLDQSLVDTGAKPQVDFHMYANGKWLRNHPIPKDQSCWGILTGLADDTLTKLYTIMNNSLQAAFGEDQQNITTKAGAFWNSAMNISQVQASGLAPLSELRTAIHQVNDSTSYAFLVGRLHSFGISGLFSLSALPDLHNSQWMILWIDQGGLGMPDQAYYFDPKQRAVKARYLQYVQTALSLAQYDLRGVYAAQNVMYIETQLAKASQTLDYRRDPYHQDNLYNLTGLQNLTGPGWDWDAYAQGLGIGLSVGDINVPNPEFLQLIGQLAANKSLLPALKAYHDFHLLSDLADGLPDTFVFANFRYQQSLTGKPTISPRWKRMLQIANVQISELVGQLYCDAYFPPESKAFARELIANLTNALQQIIPTLSWMGNATQQEALAKAQNITVKVGYPDKWINYSTLTIDPHAALAKNLLATHYFNQHRALDKLWKPVDRISWEMPPQTVNAYYEPSMNEIVFAAAVLQPPFFSTKYDPAALYGGIGTFIGHELTHGFDDAGRKYDAQGNLRDWWQPEDAEKFNAQQALIVWQYSNYTMFGQHVDGNLTAGENIADLGGVKIAYHAMYQALTANYTLGGFTQDQRFFLADARVWCDQCRKDFILYMIATDPHSPPQWRVNGPLSNLPQFYAAFDVHPGQPMWRAPEERPQIW